MLDKIKSLIIEEMTSENHAMFEDEKDIVADAIAVMLDELSDGFSGLNGDVSSQMEDIRDECGSYYQDGQWRIKGYSNERCMRNLSKTSNASSISKK